MALVGLVIGTGNAIAQGQGQGGGPPEIIFHPVNPLQGGAPTAGSKSQLTPKISFHGGPVMGTPKVFLIWYGNWAQGNGGDTAAGQQLATDFLFGLNNSNYYLINASYTLGTSLRDANIQTIVKNAITSSDVTATSGFCSKYCGWHTHSTGGISGSDIKYAFISNANRCLSSCAAQTTSPNGNAGVDGMISVIAHELEETNTDPNLNAWYDSKGAENGDKCAWTFGATQQTTGGAYYNMSLLNSLGVSIKYLVQRNLDVFSKCCVDYPNRIQ